MSALLGRRSPAAEPWLPFGRLQPTAALRSLLRRARRSATTNPPGQGDHRATVGPADNYDVTAAMSFGLLTSLGLREHHRLLDIGCGSLRVARILIPYLAPGRYVGIEPERWLVEAGIESELGSDLIELKRPRFHFGSDISELDPSERFDFAFAQSVFSHTGEDLTMGWLGDCARCLSDTGALVASFVPGDAPSEPGWTPGVAMHKASRMRDMAAEAGLGFEPLQWRHPAQTWALFARPGWDAGPLHGTNAPSWNGFLDDALQRGTVTGRPPDQRFGSLDT